MPSQNTPNKQSIMILGASSWLGYLLINRLIDVGHYSISGSLHKRKLDFGKNVDLFFADRQAQFDEVIKNKKPTFIVNFLRGEDDNGLTVHKNIINYCRDKNTHYIYASSVLALDGYNDRPLTEDLPAKSTSPYGIFKANCEKLLQGSSISWTALRFASVQGWVPHKLTRNEFFLKNLSKGEEIKVDRGVVQNRLSADLLIEGILEIIQKKLNGIFHFGTTDSSEEFHYLRKFATHFGYDPNLVLEGKQREVNLVAIPERIFTELEGDFEKTEEDTLKHLLTIPALLRYEL